MLGQDKALLLGWAVSATKIRVRPSVQYSQKKKKKTTDTPRTCIGGGSDVYPYRIRILYVIRGPSDVSM